MTPTDDFEVVAEAVRLSRWPVALAVAALSRIRTDYDRYKALAEHTDADTLATQAVRIAELERLCDERGREIAFATKVLDQHNAPKTIINPEGDEVEFNLAGRIDALVRDCYPHGWLP